MKIIKAVIAILIVQIGSLVSAPMYFEPVDLTQPDGKVIHVYLSGDEYYNWVHDKDNFTIVRDSRGYYVYADLKDGELVPTGFLVGESEPKLLSLKRGLNLAPQKMKTYRENWLKNTPKDMGKTPRTGTINNLVVFVRFSGEAEFSESLVKYDTMFNNTASGTNSMRRYFNEVSYNNLTISSTFYPTTGGSAVVSYQDIYPRSFFQPYDASTNPNGYVNSDSSRLREHALLKRAIANVELQVPSGLTIDGDNDGKVDNVCFIIDGSAGAWSSLLWPHRWVLYSYNVTLRGKRVYDYNFQLQNSLNSSGVGVLCHEMFHSLGSPDLYHYTDNGISPVGAWDIMESDQNPPQHMGAYMKYRYGGWISSIPVISNGTYTLNPQTSSTNNCFRINSPNSSTEYYVVEYRNNSTLFESKIPGTGLLVYRINTAKDGQGNAQGPPDEVYIYRPGGSPSVQGNVSSAYYSANSGRTGIANFTDPIPYLASGADGGLQIYNIGTAGNTITFTVGTSRSPYVDFASSKSDMIIGDTASFFDNSYCLPSSWSWSFSGAETLSSTLKNPTGIKYNTAGVFPVSLTAANSYGSSLLTKTGYIRVSDYSSETFESSTFPPTNWSLSPTSSTGWKRYSGASSYGAGSASAKFDFYNTSSATAQYLISNSFTSTLAGDTLMFDHAYATYSTEVDKITVETSSNGGTNWAELLVMNGGTTVGTGMVTASPTTSAFTPSSAQWATKKIKLPTGTNKLRFKAVSAYGNNAYIDKVYIVTSSFYPKVLTLRVFIEGLYNPLTDQMVQDTITVYLRGEAAPHSLVDSVRAIVGTDGYVTLPFTRARNSTNYYLQIKHRNSIETWSASTASFTDFTATADLSASSSSAYNQNLVKKGNRWCIYSGDINQDGAVNIQDVILTADSAKEHVKGYVTTDINGDGIVDLSDIVICDNNAHKAIVAVKP